MKIKIQKEINLKTLAVHAYIRYWQDAEVNGTEDEQGSLIPCRAGNNWNPIIDIDAGIITNWKRGTTAKIHYKVCDCCAWELIDEDGNTIFSKDEDYVPPTLSPAQNGYGDYIIMYVNENGKIEDWNFNLNDFYLNEESGDKSIKI